MFLKQISMTKFKILKSKIHLSGCLLYTSMAWDAIQPANLANISENLTHLATQAGGFLQRVWDFASGVALKVLDLVKDSLLAWLSEQASTVRGYSLIKVIIGKDPFTQEVVPRTCLLYTSRCV